MSDEDGDAEIPLSGVVLWKARIMAEDGGPFVLREGETAEPYEYDHEAGTMKYRVRMPIGPLSWTDPTGKIQFRLDEYGRGAWWVMHHGEWTEVPQDE